LASSVVYGAVASLTEDEFRMLDAYEGSYRKELITINTGRPGSSVEETATVYIAGPGGEEFTPAMGPPPSEEYLTAIHGQLREHWDMHDETITIRSFSGEGIIVLGEWKRPSSNLRELSLQALCVEISLRRTQPWTMPRDIGVVCSKLGFIGVMDTAAFVEALADTDSMNGRLVAAGQAKFGQETLAIAKELLGLAS
jgi:hypothetical protein